MSVLHRALFRTCLVLWAGYTAFAQPGLPACWLSAQACEIHVHFGRQHAETPHSHDYLFDLSKAQAAYGLSLLVPASLLLAWLFSNQILRLQMRPPLSCLDWFSPLEPPPPRLIPSF